MLRNRHTLPTPSAEGKTEGSRPGPGRKETSLQKEETVIYNIVKIDVIQALIE